MQRFDCLARDCPLFGPHLLEASAGTGKTFAIEHIYVRLILESFEIEQILAVTFTRAAARELKARIRVNLGKGAALIRAQEPAWEYLHPFLGSEEAARRLEDALATFDKCQIFTIHGFCYRMLKEFAFEAQTGPVSDPDEGKKVGEKLRQTAVDFLENGIEETLLCAEQLTLLFKQFESTQQIVERLLRLETACPSLSFSDLFAKCKAALHAWKLDEDRLLEDFRALEKGYKTEIKGDFEAQVKGLANLQFFPALLKERGSLFDFLAPENQKVKVQKPHFLHYPGFFEWARIHIAPFTKQKVFPVLQAAFNLAAEKILEQEEILNPDALLLRMKKALGKGNFVHLVRQKYSAAIIDEFQDTDVVQWEIFQRLFLEQPLRALYLVGDPKQSIYRFRKADVYTYLKARDLLGDAHLYHLDTNFRSSKSLVGALNALFARDWLHLPKEKRTLPYLPVKAGVETDATFSDEKGALHFFIAEGEPSALFDTVFLPFTAGEIERLQRKRCALLVKDRYQAQRALDFLKERGIAAIAKSHMPLGQTEAFRAIEELFEAVMAPDDANAAKIALAGPFVEKEASFFAHKVLLEEKGLVPFAQKLPLDTDAMQIFELLFAWERKEGFSFEGLKRFLKILRENEQEEGQLRRVEVDEEAVQIMTLHASKGLEFDVVFALGLAARTSGEEDEELDAEKQRQLYVAMTRAKKRLYVPLALSQKIPEPGTQSPLELFSRHFKGSFLEQVSLLAQTESITFEKVAPFPMQSEERRVQSEPSSSVPVFLAPRPFHPFFLSSFTTLAKPQDTAISWKESSEDLQNMPRGTETGIAIHQIFEALFSSAKPLWRDPFAIDILVMEKLRFSPLAPWKETVQQMVRQTVTTPLQADEVFFSLSEIERFQVEMEFLFSSPPNFIKGFIDLVFYHQNRVYFLDWKTNWLENYDSDSLQKAMQAHDYFFQAALYAEAIQRYFKAPFGGAFYFFVRGGAYFFERGKIA